MSRGLSLLELLVALALLAVVAGIGALAYGAMRPGLDLHAAARQVVMDLRSARVRAVAENMTVRVVFSTGASRYQRQQKRGSVYADDGRPVPLPDGIVIADCTAAGNGIGFKPRGNAATFGAVVLRNRQGAERRVIVDIAGQVRVQ